MENNLDDVLIDTLEGKSQKKSNKRIILIVVASLVLLAVLGISALMLTKQDSKPEPQNSEFDEQLEKISTIEEPKIGNEIGNSDTLNEETGKDEAAINQLIADIKTRQAQENVKPNIVQAENKKKTQTKDNTVAPAPNKALQAGESKTQEIVKQPTQKTSQDTIPQTEKKTVVASNTIKSEKKELIKPKVQEKKVPEKKAQAPQANQSKTSALPSKSASQLFQSVEKSAPKGYYLQVGVFEGTPQASFINKLKAYPYMTDKIQRSGKVLTRYLIGPFPSREVAQQRIEEITHDINKPVIVEVR